MDTTLFSTDRGTLPETIQDAAALLRSGKLVILPTDTVYSIALDLESDAARERLRALKSADRDPTWVIHVPHTAAVQTWVPDLSPMAARFLRKAWPGPIGVEFPITEAMRPILTQRLPTMAAGILATGILHLRCPDERTAQRVLEVADRPIALVGASVKGDSLPTDVATLSDRITSGVDAIIDAGPTKYRQPSTVVRIEDTVRIIRSGALDARVVQRMADTMILFVCTGNTCRSPMAAALAQRTIAASLGVTPSELPSRGITVASAGLHAGFGARATPEAVAAIGERHGELSRHQSQPVTAELVRRADRIYAMTDMHLDELVSSFPGARSKAERLDPAGNIEDPIGQSQAVYRDVAQRMEKLIEEKTPGWVSATT
jgi:L-threonylcarbamoyladenylate synthase